MSSLAVSSLLCINVIDVRSQALCGFAHLNLLFLCLWDYWRFLLSSRLIPCLTLRCQPKCRCRCVCARVYSSQRTETFFLGAVEQRGVGCLGPLLLVFSLFVVSASVFVSCSHPLLLKRSAFSLRLSRFSSFWGKKRTQGGEYHAPKINKYILRSIYLHIYTSYWYNIYFVLRIILKYILRI